MFVVMNARGEVITLLGLKKEYGSTPLLLLPVAADGEMIDQKIMRTVSATQTRILYA